MKENHPTGIQDRRYIIKGSLINSLGIVTNAVSPALVLVLARYFPQKEFGLFISLQLFVLTVSKLFALGFDKGLMWFIPKRQQDKSEYQMALYGSINRSLLFAATGCVVLVLLIYSGVLDRFETFSRLPRGVVALCLCNIVPFVVLQIGEGAFEAIRMPHIKILINRFLVNTLFPIFAILCHLLGLSYFSLAIGYTFANILGIVIYVFLLRRYFSKWRAQLAVPRQLRVYSYPLMFADVIGGMLLRLDIWMILAILGPKEAAVYSVMVVLSNGIKMVRQNFDPLLVTVISKMNRSRIQNELKDTFSFSINTITTIQFVIALFILFIPKEVLAIAGRDYTTAPIALTVLVIGNLLNGLFGGSGLILRGIGKSALMMYINVATLAINFGGNLLLISRFGLVGAAMASVFSLLFQNLCFIVAVKIITGHHFYKSALIVNLLLILLFCAAIAFGFQSIQQYSLPARILQLSVSLVAFGAFVFLRWRRKAFSR